MIVGKTMNRYDMMAVTRAVIINPANLHIFKEQRRNLAKQLGLPLSKFQVLPSIYVSMNKYYIITDDCEKFIIQITQEE